MLHKKPLRVLFPTTHQLNIIATSHKCSDVDFYIPSFLCIQVFNFFVLFFIKLLLCLVSLRCVAFSSARNSKRFLCGHCVNQQFPYHNIAGNGQ